MIPHYPYHHDHLIPITTPSNPMWKRNSHSPTPAFGTPWVDGGCQLRVAWPDARRTDQKVICGCPSCLRLISGVIPTDRAVIVSSQTMGVTSGEIDPISGEWIVPLYPNHLFTKKAIIEHRGRLFRQANMENLLTGERKVAVEIAPCTDHPPSPSEWRLSIDYRHLETRKPCGEIIRRMGALLRDYRLSTPIAQWCSYPGRKMWVTKKLNQMEKVRNDYKAALSWLTGRWERVSVATQTVCRPLNYCRLPPKHFPELSRRIEQYNGDLDSPLAVNLNSEKMSIDAELKLFRRVFRECDAQLMELSRVWERVTNSVDGRRAEAKPKFATLRPAAKMKTRSS